MHCLMYSLFFYCYAVLDIVVCVDMVEPSRTATLLGKWSHFLARNICIVLSYVVYVVSCKTRLSPPVIYN